MAGLNGQTHGGNVHAAARVLRKPVARILDFSASINPLGPSPRALRAVVRAQPLLRHYPDPDSVSLRQMLAAHWGLGMDRIVVGNGSAELIHLLPAALGIRHLAIVGPTFSEYAKAMANAGRRVTVITAERDKAYEPPLEQVGRLIRAVDRHGRRKAGIDAVILCNPNSPTGRGCDAPEVLRLARVASLYGVRLIVDETFVDYCEERSIVPSLRQADGTMVLRSFTKFYGLPGLRVGYLISNAETAELVREKQVPWSVNTLAQVAAAAALQDRPYAVQSRSFMTKERARFARQLADVPGCVVFPSEANFFLVELPAGHRAPDVAERLYRQGLLIRDCSEVPGLNERSIRLAVRRRADNRRLAIALAALLRADSK